MSFIPSSIRLVSDTKLVEFHGPADITKEDTEAIVNAANSALVGGGGVDGAIHRAGGSSLLEECGQYVAKHGRLAPGNAMITGGGRLPAKHVIHTVGPVYHGGHDREPEVLASCYRESIRVAEDHGIRSLAFPSISTGAYGYPVADAAKIAVAAVLDSLTNAKHVKTVRFVLFDTSSLNAYMDAAQTAASGRTEYQIEPVHSVGGSRT
ncbi:MAG: O-acetyl-ADP-ribose deacetylase [Acidobacteria bacterium]|nr:O-acetyl-ADP-ribose deacetylase [Acidobacteriota bacterium]